MHEKIRIGVVGAGWWASEYHIPAVLAHTEAELAAVCDPHPERLKRVMEVFSLKKTYADYHEMLEKEILDGVIIVTPHATHYSIARDCLEYQTHLLIEKPMTLFAREARELVEKAAAIDRQIMIGYTYHYHNQALRARQAITGGEIGGVEYLNSSFSSDMTGFLSGNVSEASSPIRYTVHGPSENYNKPEMMGGGQGHLQLTHPIGYLFYVTGLRARQVQAKMNNLGLRVDMVDAFTVEFENGALGLVGGTGNAHHNHRMSLAVYGQKGCYVVDTMAKFSALRKEDGTQEELDWSSSSSYRGAVTRNFIGVILGKEENYAPGEVGWRAVELLDAAYVSSKEKGRVVNIEELYR